MDLAGSVNGNNMSLYRFENPRESVAFIPVGKCVFRCSKFSATSNFSGVLIRVSTFLLVSPMYTFLRSAQEISCIAGLAI